jgi:hypothetical protein
MSHEDGYARWAAFAQATGRGAAWKAWSEDETCSQRNVARDTPAPSEATPFCARTGGGAAGCSDALEPNDGPAGAPALPAGTTPNLQICPGDSDWFRVPAAGTVRIAFSHAAGDLDLKAFDAGGRQVDVSESTSNAEEVTVPAGGAVQVYGYQGATGAYSATR